MNASFRFYLNAGLALSPFALASPAAAQGIPEAEALFNRGLADMEAGRYDPGCTAIAESQRLDPRPGTLFTLAVCASKWGHVATAWRGFGDYLALYEKLTPEQRARQGNRVAFAQKQREELGAELPELTLSLPSSAPAGTVVEQNGVVIGEVALGVALPMDPGEHVVTTRAPGGEVWEQKVTLARGEKKQVRLLVKGAPIVAGPPVKAAPAPAAPKGVAPAPPRGVPAWSWGVGGAGIASLGVGAAFAVDFARVRSTIADNCSQGTCNAAKQVEVTGALGRWNRDLGLMVGTGAVGVAGVLVGALGIAGVVGSAGDRSARVVVVPWIGSGTAGIGAGGMF